MSRKIIIMCVTLAFLAMISAAEQYAVARVTDSALAETGRIIAHIRERRLDDAAEAARGLDQTWDKQAKWLEMLVDHSSTDDVRYALSKLLAALDGGDEAAALIYAGELEGGIEHVYERQALTVENIF